MRRLLFTLLFAVLGATAAFAQSGEDALKDAEKAYDKYSANSDVMQLQEAVDAIQTAMQDPNLQAEPEAYLIAGDVYAAAVQQYVVDRTANNNEPIDPMVSGAASKAAEMYMKAYNMSDKRRYQRQALEGLENLQGNISNEGIYAIQDKQYDNSFSAFNTSVDVHNFLSDNEGESVFAEDESKLNDERYYAGLSAVLNEDYDAAEPLFMDLYEAGYDDSGLYDGLYKVYSGRGDMEKAGQYLSEGREKYPEETQLLFTEINYYLAEGRLDELIDKLQEAIDAEPDNVSLYSTLASVYDQLYQKNRGENPEKAEEYFEQAKRNYERGLEVEPDNASLIYSLGALYFNRAASKTNELVALSDDLSKEGQKKYEALEGEINDEFDKAFPYFQKAEMTDPSNRNTLIALKEIFARRDNYEASNEMKVRLERLEAGEQIESSYFEEQGK